MTKRAQRRRKAEVDEKLDQALKDSFPASDPIASIEPAPLDPADQGPAPVKTGNDKARD